MKSRFIVSLCMCMTMLSAHAQDVKNHNLEVAKNLDIFNAL